MKFEILDETLKTFTENIAAPVINTPRLLSQLRDVMASQGDAVRCLNKIVQVTAHEMRVDACSCYILRTGEVLELYATHGLRQEAVHQTRLRVGEGLIGSAAAQLRPLTTASAPSHPDFAYRPETGEELFQSLCAVPILKGGKLRGVLAIQSKRRRHYSGHDVETLQTVAMLLAELVVSSRLVEPGENLAMGDPNLQQTKIVGLSLNRGIAIGRAVLHKSTTQIRDVLAEDAEEEIRRLEKAIQSLHSSLDSLLAHTQALGQKEHAEILETYRMFAADRGWMQRIRDKITQTGLTAEAAVHAVQEETASRMGQVVDAYLKSRVQDFEDLTNRLLMHLAGYEGPVSNLNLPDDAVLVARSLGPADFLEYDQRKIKAIVLEEGSPSSHVAIMARALGVPIISQCRHTFETIDALDQLIVDGDNAIVLVRPGEEIVEIFQKSLEERQRLQALQLQEASSPAVTKDKTAIAIMLNGGLLNELPDLEALSLDGIGLYRTEIPFMMQDQWPSGDLQLEWYRKAIEKAKSKPIVFRTLDIGSDKKLPYLPSIKEDNPALGWRGIRIGLDRPHILSTQLRAMLHAVGNGTLWVMFPMITDMQELSAAKSILFQEIKRCRAKGEAVPNEIKIGIMVEVPSLLWQLPSILAEIDFVSVGSNDLLQYMYAADRGNSVVVERFDPLSPGFLNALRFIVQECAKSGTLLSICGEMAGKPLDAMVLLGLGFRSLSMSPHVIGSIKSMIRSLNLQAFSSYLNQLLTLPPQGHSYRAVLSAYARDHGIRIDDLAS